MQHPLVTSCFQLKFPSIHEKPIIESMDSVCMCVTLSVCACVHIPCGSVHFVLFEFGQQDRDKAVAKLNRLLQKQCSVCAGLFRCHFPGDALGTCTLSRPLLAL